MNLLSACRSAFSALRLGHELHNAAAWKNAQAVSNFLSALLAVVVALGYDPHLTDVQIYALGGLIAALANAYFTLATSSKVGILPPQPETDASPRPDVTPPHAATLPKKPLPAHAVTDADTRRVHDPVSSRRREQPPTAPRPDPTTPPGGWEDR
jgi:hypothetical protein